MNELGESCYPSTKSLSEETGLSERSVCTHLELAERDGWIVRRVMGFSGQGWKRYAYSPSIPPDALNEIQRVKALNDVQHDNEGTEPHAEGTEPDDKKALNDVQWSTSVNSSLSTPVVTAAPRKREKPRTTVPEHMPITDAMREWAESKTPNVDIKTETENFLDHHRSKGNKFADLEAAWRTWMRNSQKWGKTGGNHETHQPIDNSAPARVRRANEQRERERQARAVVNAERVN